MTFAATFFLMLNQLMYQEHSIVYEWYRSSPGYHVLWLMLTFWAGIAAVALIIYHHWRDGLAVLCLGMIWVFFFLFYTRIIEMDVNNKITSGDLPPDGDEMLKNISDVAREGWLDDTHVTVVLNAPDNKPA
ncbi:hypothetical protein [Ralstonia phage RSF1]|uniref:Uncharacterized protein n=1 Tax=Ralstonia phage RSF1 TaxID=1689679 RepID=A0A0K2QQE3_9CAUD|nr:hypothetical protein AVU11_gp013 [Ralstonia phage RSF1]BAS04805.2 hypothetical protein [Ralstonia phage RSF1]